MCVLGQFNWTRGDARVADRNGGRYVRRGLTAFERDSNGIKLLKSSRLENITLHTIVLLIFRLCVFGYAGKLIITQPWIYFCLQFFVFIPSQADRQRTPSSRIFN